MTAQILSLHSYPVKSCAGIDLSEAAIDRAGLTHDRRWMILTSNGQFMTQRRWPAMARIRTGITASSLRLQAPGMSVLEIPLDGSGLAGPAREVIVWKDTVPARSEGAQAAAWFSRFLQRDCELVKIDVQARRHAKSEWVERWRAAHPDLAGDFAGDHGFGFADGFPLLVTNQASLDDLNSRLAAQGKAPVPMNRFRPNIVVQGDWQAYEEDHTAVIASGSVRMAFVKPCTRCPMPNIDQLTAERYDEPGRTLATYRTLEIGVVFGQNAIVQAPAGARLRVGDPVEIELDF